MIDSTIVRALACVAGSSVQKEQALGRSYGGFTIKIHFVTDALGILLRWIVSPGQGSDIKYAGNLLCDFTYSYVLADRAYDCGYLIDQSCILVIPSKLKRRLMRKSDKHIYKERAMTECYVSKFKFLDVFFLVTTSRSSALVTSLR
jgi:hypothetical protein